MDTLLDFKNAASPREKLMSVFVCVSFSVGGLACGRGGVVCSLLATFCPFSILGDRMLNCNINLNMRNGENFL